MGSVSSEPGASQRTGLIKQPLDLELPVVATGARPGDNAEKRELFTEETHTVLVFENGCVIQLAAAVNVGQLVFLMIKESGKEVVTQVLRKRSFRPTDCYVELEFTEPAPEFWGHKFPDEKTATKANAGAVAEAEVTEDDAAQSVPAPDAAEVAKLRQEVEALRTQLKSPGQPKESGAEKENQQAAEPKEASEQHTEMQQPSANELATLKSLLGPKTPAHEPEPEEEKPAEVQAATEPKPETQAKEETLAFPFRMQLPKADESVVRSSEFAADTTALAAVDHAENQLPQPSLDFEQFPGLKEPRTKLFSGKATRSLSGPIGAMVAAVLFLIAAGIATYRMGWLPKFGAKSSKSDANKSAFGPAPHENSADAPASSTIDPSASVSVPKVEAASVDSGQPHVENNGHNPPGDVMPGKRSTGEMPGAVAPMKKPEPRASTVLPEGKKSAPIKVAKNGSPETVAPQEDAYVPPKLLKAIKSLSPPEAIRKYVSGNVTLDALVDETGHVVSATPLAGPKALYPRAVETVKDYLYQPATRNGRPVPARVEVKIQFWYEP